MYGNHLHSSLDSPIMCLNAKPKAKGRGGGGGAFAHHRLGIILLQPPNTKCQTHNKKEKRRNSHLGYLSTKMVPKGGLHIDLLAPSHSIKERMHPRLNVQSVAHPFHCLGYSKGAQAL